MINEQPRERLVKKRFYKSNTKGNSLKNSSVKAKMEEI